MRKSSETLWLRRRKHGPLTLRTLANLQITWATTSKYNFWRTCSVGRLDFYRRWLKKTTCLMPFLHASHMQPKARRDTRRRLCCSEKRRCKCNGGFRTTIYFWAYLPRADRWHHVGEECKTAASTSSPRNSNYTFLWIWLQLPWIYGLCTAGQCTLRRYETLSVHA